MKHLSWVVAAFAVGGATANAWSQPLEAVLVADRVQTEVGTGKTVLTVRNTGDRNITAWSLQAGEQFYAEELFYSVGMESELSSPRPRGFGGLRPGESMTITLPAAVPSSVQVNAAILEDGSAIGDETALTAISAYRAAYVAEWRRWSLVLPADTTRMFLESTERREILRELGKATGRGGDAYSIAGERAARDVLRRLLTQTSDLPQLRRHVRERLLALSGQTKTSASPKSRTLARVTNFDTLKTVSGVRLGRPEISINSSACVGTAASAVLLAGGTPAQTQTLGLLELAVPGGCAGETALPRCEPSFLTSLDSGQSIVAMLGLGSTEVSGIGCGTFASQLVSTRVIPGFSPHLLGPCAVPAPTITSINPAAGPVGTNVVITGTNFGAGGAVALGGTGMGVSSWNDTSITAQVAPGSQTGNVVVTNAGGSSNGVQFTVVQRIIPVLSMAQYTLWFFGAGRPRPPNFYAGDVAGTVTSNFTNGGNYHWTISDGTRLSFDKARVVTDLVNNSNSMVVYTTGGSMNASDVEVSLVWTAPEGYQSGAAPVSVTVDQPYSLAALNGSPNPTVPTRAVATCGPPWPPAAGNPAGFWSQYTWQIHSFFGQIMSGTNINENFVNVMNNQPNNLAPVANGSDGANGVSTFTDNYCYANQTVGNPRALPPQNPLGNNLIWSATQVYSIGSSTPGMGLPVQHQTLSRYQDHDTVANITR